MCPKTTEHLEHVEGHILKQTSRTEMSISKSVIPVNIGSNLDNEVFQMSKLFYMYVTNHTGKI